MRVRPVDSFLFLAKRINIFKNTQAVFTVFSSNFKQLQRLKYKIPENPMLAPLKLKVEVNTLKKKTRCLKSTLTA